MAILFQSTVPKHEGLCKSIWLNKNQICNRLDRGTTGFFKNVKKFCGLYFKFGKEFHGIVREKLVVEPIASNE